MLSKLKSWLYNAVLALDDSYYAVLPFATILQWYKVKRQVDADYDALWHMTDMADDVFTRLNKIGFKISDEHKDLRAIVQRGQVVPYAADATTVEVDAHVWIEDQLRDIQTYVISYELAGKIEVIPTYEPERDVILFVMQPIAKTIKADMQRFLHINATLTIGFILYIATVLFLI